MANKTDLYQASLNICDTHRPFFGRVRLGFHLPYGEGSRDALLRLLAGFLFADVALQCRSGGSRNPEPDLYVRGADGRLALWVCLGAPSPGRLARACKAADRVAVLGAADEAWDRWWGAQRYKLARLTNLEVVAIAPASLAALSACLSNRVRWHGVLDHETLWLHHGAEVTELTPRRLLGPGVGRLQVA